MYVMDADKPLRSLTQHPKDLTGLTSLEIGIDEMSLLAISQLLALVNLRRLIITNCNSIGDEGMAAIGFHLVKLQDLTLFNCGVSATAVKELLASMVLPELAHLVLYDLDLRFSWQADEPDYHRETSAQQTEAVLRLARPWCTVQCRSTISATWYFSLDI